MKFKKNTKINILSPIVRGRKGEHKAALADVKKQGFLRVRVNGDIKNIDDKIDNENNNMQFNNEEIEIFKKISEWPKCVEISTKKLEPHRIPVYLYELSSQFHSYWNMGKDDVEKRFINDDKTINIEKLIFLKSIAKTIKTGMDIIGVDTPEKM